MSKKKLETIKIINTLKTALSYPDLVSHVDGCQSNINQVMNFHFQDSLFSKGEKFHFPYTIESAVLIIRQCTLFTNSKDLLTAYHFGDALNLHTSSFSLIEANEDYTFYKFNEFDEENFQNSEFGQSSLSQDDYFSNLKIANWSYENLVVSATFFYLKYIHFKCLEKKICLTSTNVSDQAFVELKAIGSDIALLLLSHMFGKKLFYTLKKTNLFLVYPDIWLYAFSAFIKSTGSNVLYDYESQNNKYFFNKIQQNTLFKFSHIFLYLKAFEGLIPKKIRKVIFLTCYNIKTVHILYYILKKYENIFDSSIKPNRQKYNDYVLNTKISYKLIEFETQLEVVKNKWEELL